jgi:hypothetical protein
MRFSCAAHTPYSIENQVNLLKMWLSNLKIFIKNKCCWSSDLHREIGKPTTTFIQLLQLSTATDTLTINKKLPKLWAQLRNKQVRKFEGKLNSS